MGDFAHGGSYLPPVAPPYVRLGFRASSRSILRLIFRLFKVDVTSAGWWHVGV